MSNLREILPKTWKILQDEDHEKIVKYLYKKGDQAYMTLKTYFKLKKKIFENRMSNLMRYGLIYNYYTVNEYNNKYLYYCISKIGKKFAIHKGWDN